MNGRRSLWVYLAIITMGLSVVGCSSGSDTVDVPKTATEGGNVIKDENLRRQMLGAAPDGGGKESSGLSTQ